MHGLAHLTDIGVGGIPERRWGLQPVDRVGADPQQAGTLGI